MMGKIQLQPEDCTPFGRLVLRHLRDKGLSLRELAKSVGVAHPTLRSLCLGQHEASEATFRKLMGVFDIPPMALYFVVYGNGIQRLANDLPDGEFEPLLKAIAGILDRYG